MLFNHAINGRRLTQMLAAIALYLAAQSLVNEFLLENVLGSESDSVVALLLDLFSVNLEGSIPTWYSTLLLFACAGLLGFIAIMKRKNDDSFARHWAGLAFIFLYLSIDEGVAIHELLTDPLQAAFNTTGYLTFAWLIVFVPLLGVVGLLYVRFLLHLSPQMRNRILLAAMLYVGGAVVVESISANRWYLDGGVSFAYLAIATVEELFEMWGVILFMDVLLQHVADVGYTAVLRVTPTQPQPARQTPAARWGLLAVVLLNAGLGYAVYIAHTAQAATAPTAAAFYQAVSEQYAGEGVVILQINDAILPDQAPTHPYTSALHTLFTDVLIVTFPNEQTSVAFASNQLPFTSSDLEPLLGEQQYLILD